MRKIYASRLTKEDLIKGGITCITKEGLVFKGEKEAALSVNCQGYLMLNVIEVDEAGNKIKIPVKKSWGKSEKLYDSYNYRQLCVGLHRAMWAWFHGEVPEGYVVDHINNKHTELEDYNLDNLQLLTPAENLKKEKGESTKTLICKLNKPLSFYEEKLDKYLAEYETAKKTHNAELAHKLRGNIANTKARIRYYNENIEIADEIKAKLIREQIEKQQMQELKELNKIKKKKESEEYHKIAKMKKEVNEWSKSLDWSQGKDIRRFIRLFDKDRDLETLKQLYNIMIEKKENK